MGHQLQNGDIPLLGRGLGEKVPHAVIQPQQPFLHETEGHHGGAQDFGDTGHVEEGPFGAAAVSLFQKKLRANANGQGRAGISPLLQSLPDQSIHPFKCVHLVTSCLAVWKRIVSDLMISIWKKIVKALQKKEHRGCIQSR